jgi:hypothetical protein
VNISHEQEMMDLILSVAKEDEQIKTLNRLSPGYNTPSAAFQAM